MVRAVVRALLLALALAAPALAVSKAAPASPAEDGACLPDKLTVYKVVMHTFWSRDRFPKHYPDWRPPAQWSKVIGRSHDASYSLFRLGQAASPGVRAMAETGRSEVLEDENQGVAGVFDEFSAPPVHAGAGWTQAEFFVDGNHSRVSLMSRIVPSPDWFIGIDSFDLCVDGSWIDSITIEVDPLDAGTDNGFTFTAPNWPTEPQGVVYRITSGHPQHPAGSFYYPFLKRLPPIGTFQFIKVKEYELSEVFHHTEDSQHFDVFRAVAGSGHPNSIPVVLGQDAVDAVQQEMEAQRQEEERRMQQELTTIGSPSAGVRRVMTVVPAGDKAGVVNSILNTYGFAGHGQGHGQGHGPWGAYSYSTASTASTASPVTTSTSFATSATSNATLQPRPARRKHKTVRKIRAPRDCRVSEWGAWGECSKSCGIGEMQRRRQVVKHPRRGGRACPPLLETKWCGSARDCTGPAKDYFKW